jgi:hypothetical protein
MGGSAESIRQGLDQAWQNIIAFSPKVAAFLIILLIGYFLAKLIAKVIVGGLARLGFNKLIERGGLRRALERTGYKVEDVLGRLIFYALLLFVLQLAFAAFGRNPISDLLNSIVAFLPNIVVALVVIVIAAAVGAVVKDIVAIALDAYTFGPLLADASSAAIVVVGVFAALNQLQIAQPIVNGLFYALLAVVAGSLIVAVGGGGIVPMRRQWEIMIQRLEEHAKEAADRKAAVAPPPNGGEAGAS